MDVAPATRKRATPTRILIVVVALVFVLLLVVPLLWPVPPLEGTVPPRQLAGQNSEFVEIDGIEFHYLETGDPDASCNVILLHGFGASVFSWRDTLPALAARCRTVAFDRPAFGLTSRPMPGEWGETNPYSLTAQADQTIELMDALEMERAVLVGHSAGSAVAVLAAQRHPERVSGLVLEAPALYASGPVPSWFSPLLRTPQARRIGPLLVRRIGGAGSDDFIRSAYADASLVTPELLQGYRTPLRAHAWDRALWELTAAPRPDDPAQALAALTVPTLVVYGQLDAIVPPGDSQRAGREILGAQTVGIPHVGHLPHEEVPGAFETLIFRFLDDLEAAGIP